MAEGEELEWGLGSIAGILSWPWPCDPKPGESVSWPSLRVLSYPGYAPGNLLREKGSPSFSEEIGHFPREEQALENKGAPSLF